ncbi:unnamed protein product [Brassicogethes aeneus]|uniref:protein-tyrosine-phosphatase n=1 Tax=Brassicogethes aeneus TaxID=1431903 RepID=A0A9P0FLI8_BRAAE|nr:unnamed protein product [Brassicogethes aeneus]
MTSCTPMKRKKRSALKMENFDNVLINASEFIRGKTIVYDWQGMMLKVTGRLYFVSLNTNVKPKSTPSVHYFGVDTELNYDSFYMDFGPLNLSMLYHYCVKLKSKLSNSAFHNKKIVHFTGDDNQKRVNAAFLIGSYAVIYLNYEPEQAYEILVHDSAKEYLEFRDASVWEPYTLSLLNCLKAIKKAHSFGYFNFDNFDFLEYEHYERVENGDFNWILPNKFIAFCGPHNRSQLDKGYPIHAPETYFAYFRRHKVTTIVRLNTKVYDSNRFLQAGFDHKDLYFVDGGIPSDRILNQFINICETARGAVAVHCKAGLGRTGSLIACYIMKHFKFTAEEAIAWIRICRPGSIIGHQQTWLQEKQKSMWDAGEIYRKRNGMSGPFKYSNGIYSLADENRNKTNDNVTGIMEKVDCMEINDKEEFASEENKITQGDKLNEIKAQRLRAKPLGNNVFDQKPPKTQKVSITTSGTTMLRGGKILTGSVRSSSSTSSRLFTKRIETKDSQVRRVQRKVLTPPSSEKNQLSEQAAAAAKRAARKKQSPWLSGKNGCQNGNVATIASGDVGKAAFKRGKRTLQMEKDKNSPRSVKVLRRSHGQTKEAEIGDGKLRLPSLKVNKTL